MFHYHLQKYGKVMFSQVFVCPQEGGVISLVLSFWEGVPMSFWGWVSLVPGSFLGEVGYPVVWVCPKGLLPINDEIRLAGGWHTYYWNAFLILLQWCIHHFPDGRRQPHKGMHQPII